MNRPFETRNPIFSLISLTILALFCIGCGSSSDTVNVNGTNDRSGNVGTVQFRFQAAATTQTTVPAGTATLQFDFYTTATPAAETFSFAESRAFAELINISVPTDVRSVIVTAFDSNNTRLVSLLGSFEVVENDTIDVALQDVGDEVLLVAATPEVLQTGVNLITYTALATTTNSNIQQSIPESELEFQITSAPNGVTIATNGDITVPSNISGTVTVQVSFGEGVDALVTSVNFTIPQVNNL